MANVLIKNTPTRYGIVTIVLHWLVAFAVVGLFALGLWMVTLDYYSSWYQRAPSLHKSIGIILFIVMLIRLLWKLLHVSPQYIATHSTLERILGKIVHVALYFLMFAIMISGYLISTADGRAIDVFSLLEVPSLGEFFANQEDIAGLVHEYLAYTLIAVVVCHAAAALKHHFIDKDLTLKRILSTSNP